MQSSAVVFLSVYDLAGRIVAQPIAGWLTSGLHAVSWDGKTSKGSALPAGVYFAQLEIGAKRSALKRLVLLK